jgi:4'-phosphopantetheinyl transferase
MEIARMLVGIMDVSPLFEDEALFGKCLESVSESRRERAEHYKDYRDKCRCVGAGVLLNVMLGKYLAEENLREAYKDDLIDFKINKAVTLVNPDLNWNVTYSEKGKPEFLQNEILRFINKSNCKLNCELKTNVMPETLKFEKNINCNINVMPETLKFTKYPDSKAKSSFTEDVSRENMMVNIFFNISHSANYVACVIADSPVGIDIEGRRKVNSSVAKRYFTEIEIESIHSDADFFKIWTFKEALGKCTGEGLMPVIGKSEKDVQDEVSVNRYTYDDFQICVVRRKH